MGFFGIAFGWTWLYWSLFIFQIIKLPSGIGTPNVTLKEILVYVPIVVFSPFGPTFGAFILTYINEGKEAVRELWRRSWNRDVPSKWILATFLWYPSLNILYRLISALAFNINQPQPQWLSNPLTIIIPFLASILNGGLSEEIGWRGYALPRLQARFNAVESSLILGFMEGLWHVPLVFWVGDSRYGMSITLLIVWQMITTFYRTWIFNNTDGSILTAMLFHAMGNTAGHIIPYNLARIEWLPNTKVVTPFLLTINILVIISLVLIFGAETMSLKARAISINEDA